MENQICEIIDFEKKIFEMLPKLMILNNKDQIGQDILYSVNIY